MSDEITPAELGALLDADKRVRIVDIRSAAAFERGHIPGSENVPFAELPRRAEEFTDAERIVTVCPHGEASQQAARLLGSAAAVGDARVESLVGGMAAWDGDLDASGASAPTETEDTSEAPF